MWTRKNEHQVKDKKIQIYRVDIEKNGTTKQYFKHYIYNIDVFKNGGIWAYIRNETNEEKYRSGRAIDSESLKAIINYRGNITSNLKVEFNGKIYDIKNIDRFEYYKDDITLYLVESKDKTTYQGELRYE